jgi:hypothetical protein
VRIKITDGSSVTYTLMVDRLVHSLKRSPVQIPLPFRRVMALDLGSCLEIITLQGITDEINGPTKSQLEDAVRSWGSNVDIMNKSGYPVLQETAHDTYSGLFGGIKFDYEAATGEVQKFELTFKVVLKIHTP